MRKPLTRKVEGQLPLATLATHAPRNSRCTAGGSLCANDETGQAISADNRKPIGRSFTFQLPCQRQASLVGQTRREER